MPTLERCDCSPYCEGQLVFGDADAELSRKVNEFFALPKCARCKLPTPDEAVDPYWWEAGERMCEPCGLPERPAARASKRGKARRGKSSANADATPAVRDASTGRFKRK